MVGPNEADPDAKLFYNDYNETRPDKRDKIYRLVKELLEGNVPIHGIGMQGHWRLNGPSADEIGAALELYGSLGLDIQITELDVSIYDWQDKNVDLLSLDPATAERLERRYDEIFRLLREYQTLITGVMFWGIADDSTWLDNFPVQGRKDWPLLFDVQHQPKAAFWKVIDSLGNGP